MTQQTITIIGGGLAGTEAAWQAASRGVHVHLYEMRPQRGTEAHTTDRLAELVCSNSMGSTLPDRALGLLKNEMLRLGSLVIETAFKHSLPAGAALAVSRDDFSREITEIMASHPNITLHREEVTAIPEGPAIVATGPLTSPALAAHIQELTGSQYLYFYDAMAPIVVSDSIDMTVAFRQSRYDKDSGQGTQEGDYINCPLTREEYERFVEALLSAPKIELKGADKELERYFEGCMPIEALAARGGKSLSFGPMRPVGLRDPRSGRRPFAAVQLRQDNVAGTLYNMVGFQTNIKWGAQEEVLRLIPGLADAEFVRLGQMHRNTFINSPTLLRPTLQLRGRQNLFFAGQITGTEGYVGSTMGGLIAGYGVSRVYRSRGKSVASRTLGSASWATASAAAPARWQSRRAAACHSGTPPDSSRTVR
jgi:methylenetetrahydrofolate--tRNA-(uracil-5-)-methyltransferase